MTMGSNMSVWAVHEANMLSVNIFYQQQDAIAYCKEKFASDYVDAGDETPSKWGDYFFIEHRRVKNND